MAGPDKPPTQKYFSPLQYKETERQTFKRKRNIAYGVVGIVAVLAAGIIASLVTWFVLRDPPAKTDPAPFRSEVNLGKSILRVSAHGPAELFVHMPRHGAVRKLTLGAHMKEYAKVSQDDPSSTHYRFENQHRNYSLKITHDAHNGGDFSCIRVKWTAGLEDSVKDCLGLGSGHWYGGGLLFNQHWPMKLQKSMTPFTSADILQVPSDYGSLLEPYWISSDGIALSVRYTAKNEPLHTSWNENNDGSVCIMASYKNSPFVHAQQKELQLEYSVCTASDISDLHKQMLHRVSPWPRPTKIPSEALLERPIWSTWASYKTALTQNDVRDFVDQITNLGFPASNIEIDDGYHEHYGDYTFNSVKFPQAKEIIDYAKSKGYNVTIWVYPFVNTDAQAFWEGFNNRHYVQSLVPRVPAMSWWWQGNLTALIDFTKPDAADWYIRRLQDFQEEYGLESYKFDGGESGWMPRDRVYYDQSVNPDYYGKVYAEKVTAKFGTGLEVRIGLHTQQLPVFVRMLDKDSVSGYDNGLRSLIPTALTFGLLGYPFVLPDMIGGNGYRNDSSTTSNLLGMQYPSARMYLRWLGATVFMPSIQFSITPWHYENAGSQYSPVATARTLLQLRQKYQSDIFKLAQEAVDTGFPILRPLWWINGNDPDSWTVDDQFLVGDNIMVAPVLSAQDDFRSVYIPPGKWYDILESVNRTGPIRIDHYNARIHQVPVFERYSE